MNYLTEHFRYWTIYYSKKHLKNAKSTKFIMKLHDFSVKSFKNYYIDLGPSLVTQMILNYFINDWSHIVY